ncbi:MAG: sensor histidine kinase [Flavobacteriales bacterium]|nr:sensor histidine kinase [Flavobacteriales bacterium]
MTFKGILVKISSFGIPKGMNISSIEKKQIIFYNQAMIIGFFATISQIFFVWPFIGAFSLSYLSITAVIGICIYFSSKGYFQITKTVSLFFIYLFGAFMTTYLGGAGYFHVGAITIFLFSLIVFDLKKEKIAIFLGLGLTMFSLFIGEFGLFNAPDFSSHPFIQVSRITNILSFTCINFIFIIFIIKLNLKTERELSSTLEGNEILLRKLTATTNDLIENRQKLEETIMKRTSRISSQRNVLEIQNNEKEVLLQEVHHRVKNNLQIIISLINLQRTKFEDKDIEEALSETQNRVLSMALVHQKMYQASNFTEIGLDEYIAQLVDNIQDLYLHKTHQNFIEVERSLTIDLETAIPLGLIINEVVTNFFKYACFPGDENSHFKIKVRANKNGSFNFRFKDNGPGFPERTDIETVSSLGLRLIKSLVEQIEGQVKFYNDNGAVYELTFRKKEV